MPRRRVDCKSDRAEVEEGRQSSSMDSERRGMEGDRREGGEMSEERAVRGEESCWSAVGGVELTLVRLARRSARDGAGVASGERPRFLWEETEEERASNVDVDLALR